MLKNKKKKQNQQERLYKAQQTIEHVLPLITVAVPVYNSEKHLGQCLESIMNQTYSHLEILLVNDGSTDGSMEICETYSLKDSRIRVFHKQNGGVGASRNTLLELIQGDYVTFVDNDDWLEKEHIEKLYDQLIRKAADISVANFSSYIEDRHVFQFHGDFQEYFEKDYSPEEWFTQEYNTRNAMSQCFTVPWGKLYKSSLVKGLAFPEDKTVEDDYTTYLIYLSAQKITYGHRQTYIHRKSGGSITQTVNQTDVFPLATIEERLTLLALLGYDLTQEMKAYRWRLKLHQQEYLKQGNVVSYRRTTKKLEIISKRGEEKQ